MESAELVREFTKMNDTIAGISMAMAKLEASMTVSMGDLAGKLKGNHELLTQELTQYVTKDTCQLHRENQGERIGILANKVAVLEDQVSTLREINKTKSTNTSDAIVAWVPSIISIIGIAAVVIYLTTGGHLQ